MRNILLGALWFCVVFLLGVLLFFPVDAVVRGQVQQLEEQTGIRLRWTGEQWSLWKSVLSDVSITDRSGREWVHLQWLELKPRFNGLYVLGKADWGGLDAVVAPGGTVANVDGYPIPKPPNLNFEDGRLRVHVEFEQALFKSHGNLNLSGRGGITAIYEGPVDLSGSFELNGAQGTASLEVLGDRLRGHGEMTFVAGGGDWGNLQITGPMRIERQGQAFQLKVQYPGNPPILPQ